MENEYICLSCDQTSNESDLHSCPRCGKYSCRYCGGEIQTIEEYEENERINAEESK